MKGTHISVMMGTHIAVMKGTHILTPDTGAILYESHSPTEAPLTILPMSQLPMVCQEIPQFQLRTIVDSIFIDSLTRNTITFVFV